MEGTRRAPIVFASLVLLLNGVGAMVAAILNAVGEHTAAATALGLVLAIAGGAMITAGVRLSAGSRNWWMASLGLLPMTAAFHWFDASAFGGGRLPIAWGVVMPTIALGCLVLPSVRASYLSTSGSTKAKAPI